MFFEKLCCLALALMFLLSAAAENTNVIRSAAELAARIQQMGPYDRQFKLHAIAVTGSPKSDRGSMIVADASGRVQIGNIHADRCPRIVPGDRIVVTGALRPSHNFGQKTGYANPNCSKITFVSHGPPIEPIDVRPEDIDNYKFRFFTVRIKGMIVDVRTDEIDDRYVRFVLDCSGQTVNGAIKCSFHELMPMIGSTIEITGLISPPRGARLYGGCHINAEGMEAIHVIKPPSADMFRVPDLKPSAELSPKEIATMGKRKVSGWVLAVWNGNMMLLRTADGILVTVNLITSPPAVGDCVETVGKVETNFYHINLMRSIWRKSMIEKTPETRNIREIEIRDLFINRKDGSRSAAYFLHGETVRLTGKVWDCFMDDKGSRHIILESQGNSVSIECNATIGNLETGSILTVTGVCILETEIQNQYSVSLRTPSISVVVSSPRDIKVESFPPWWTPARLTAVICALVLFIAAILVWNASLRTLSERRGRELYRNQIERAKSELRVDERTRLAAELHDHLAQNLTAISYRLAAAKRSQTMEPNALSRHLATATRMLGSCRTELRRCLWDLRSDALDEPDFTAAIGKSTEAVAGDAEMSICWNMARAKISDSTAHAILSITRELVSNAVRHGKARKVRISGEFDSGVLRCSVIDDGCGFVPADANGAAEGHFGLDGIRERLRRHGGEMTVESAPGKGAAVFICMQITGNGHEKPNQKNQNPIG